MLARHMGLDADQQALWQLCHEFVDQEVLPYVRTHRDQEWLASPEDRVPWTLVGRATDLGLRDLCVPERFGGAGESMSALTLAVLAEELGRGDAGFSDMLIQNWKISRLLATYLSPEQQETWFPRITEDPLFLLAHAITEPSGASDRWLRNNSPEAALKTRAERRGDRWVLNGRKQYISNGFDAKLFVVYACTDPTKGMFDGSTSFLVPRGAPGFRQGRAHEKIGSRFMNNAELIFDDCEVPDEQVLVRDAALSRGDVYFRPGKILQAAKNLGLAQVALDDTVAFVESTTRGGQILMKHQAVANTIGRMTILLESCRAFVYHAARAVDADTSDAHALCLMAKVYASEAVFEVCKAALELHGGAGVMRETGVEKHLRDASIFLHMDGTNDIHRFRIVKSLFPASAGSYTAQQSDG